MVSRGDSSDFRDAGHLPNNRVGRNAADPFDLPAQRRGKTPQMFGRYPDYDVMEQADHWDDVTRELVESRLEPSGPLRFFDEVEAAVLGPFCDTVMAQDCDPKVPVLAMVDKKLHQGKLEGYRYDYMPDDRETWRLVAQGLDQSAQERFEEPFESLTAEQQVELTRGFAGGELSGGVWDELPPAKAWSVVMRSIVTVFYSHPWAWNEIGYAGPAYPRGYMRLGPDQREPYERPEATSEDPVREVKERGMP